MDLVFFSPCLLFISSFSCLYIHTYIYIYFSDLPFWICFFFPFFYGASCGDLRPAFGSVLGGSELAGGVVFQEHGRGAAVVPAHVHGQAEARQLGHLVLPALALENKDSQGLAQGRLFLRDLLRV